jgi:hypothetical protein
MRISIGFSFQRCWINLYNPLPNKGFAVAMTTFFGVSWFLLPMPAMLQFSVKSQLAHILLMYRIAFHRAINPVRPMG